MREKKGKVLSHTHDDVATTKIIDNISIKLTLKLSIKIIAKQTIK